MTIAEKYAQQYLPNGEVSLEQVIQAAINDAMHMMHKATEMDDGTISMLQERIRQLESQPVAVVGEPDCYDAGLLGYFGGGNVEWWQDYIRSELARAHEFYVSQWPSSIPAAELDALRKDAERYRWLRDDAFEHSADCFMDAGQLFAEHHGDSFDAAIDAAIAQEKGE